MRPRLALVVVLALAFVVSLRLAVRGPLPQLAIGLVATAALVALVGATFELLVALGPLRTDERGEARALLRRHGFWVIVLAAGVALPTLGSFGLVDPWETHYAEVAREMIERRDLVSPWWANEGWFFSKPVLLFWLEALSMVVLGVPTGPDAVLAGGAHPEWAVRLPGFACAILGTYALYNGVSRTVGRRAGFLGAVVLWTTPGLVLLSHQAITDMPLVAGIAGALGLFARALATPDDEETRTLLPGRALAAVVVVLLLAQAAIIVFSRASIGSPHACGLPSQPACAAFRAVHPRLTPLVQLSVLLPLAGTLGLHLADERRTSRLLAHAAWLSAALATMAKGPVGLVLPLAGSAFAVVAMRSPRAVLRMAPLTGVLLAVALIVPWYFAAWARHGRAFTDELVFRHMLGRTLEHLHDTNEGEDTGIFYFVRQLATATFPWSGLVAVGALAAAARPDERSRRAPVRALLASAALVGFGLVTAMRTKFHHYAMPIVPPLAMLAGIFVDELVATSRGCLRRASAAVLVLTASAGTLLVGLEQARVPARFALLLTYRYTREWASTQAFATTFTTVALVATVTLIAAAVGPLRRAGLFGLATTALALALLLVHRYLPGCAADGGQRGVLDAYYRDRALLGGREPLVAYQLNWKGENFYTGNHVAIWKTSGVPFRAWLGARKEAGPLWFVTERGRVASLRAELGSVASFVELTPPADAREYVLVRATLLR